MNGEPGAVVAEVAAGVAVLDPDATAGDARRQVRRHPPDTADAVAVCEGTELLGLVTAERLVGVADDTLELAAWRAIEAGWSLVGVTEHGRFIGALPAARLCAGLLAEHRQDLARLSGFLHDVDAVRQVGRERVLRPLCPPG